MNQTSKPKRKSRRVPPASGRRPSQKLSEGDWQALSDELMRYYRRARDVFGRREQWRWSIFYLCGQLSALERKTIEPMVLELLGRTAMPSVACSSLPRTSVENSRYVFMRAGVATT